MPVRFFSRWRSAHAEAVVPAGDEPVRMWPAARSPHPSPFPVKASFKSRREIAPLSVDPPVPHKTGLPVTTLCNGQGHLLPGLREVRSHAPSGETDQWPGGTAVHQALGNPQLRYNLGPLAHHRLDVVELGGKHDHTAAHHQAGEQAMQQNLEPICLKDGRKRVVITPSRMECRYGPRRSGQRRLPDQSG